MGLYIPYDKNCKNKNLLGHRTVSTMYADSGGAIPVEAVNEDFVKSIRRKKRKDLDIQKIMSEVFTGPRVKLICTSEDNTMNLSTYVNMRFCIITSEGEELYMTKTLLIIPN